MTLSEVKRRRGEEEKKKTKEKGEKEQGDTEQHADGRSEVASFHVGGNAWHLPHEADALI